jgi:hypothetical protein
MLLLISVIQTQLLNFRLSSDKVFADTAKIVITKITVFLMDFPFKNTQILLLMCLKNTHDFKLRRLINYYTLYNNDYIYIYPSCYANISGWQVFKNTSG